MSSDAGVLARYLETLDALVAAAAALRPAIEASDFGAIGGWRTRSDALSRELAARAGALEGFSPTTAEERAAVARLGPGLEAARAAQGLWESWDLGMTTLQKAGATWVRQALENLAALGGAPGAGVLAGALPRVPAIIVSAGPSLARNIERLRGIGDRALIIALNRTAQALLEVGVRPHAVMVGDAQDLTAQLATAGDIDLLAVRLSVHPQVAAFPASRRVWYASSALHETWIAERLGDPHVLRSWGSVSHVAFDLAVSLGCDPIIMAGQDLALDEGRMYSDRTITSLDAPAAQLSLSEDGTKLLWGGPNWRTTGRRWPIADVVQVPGWRGGTVPTTTLMKTYLDGFSELAAEQASQRLLVNATEGGAAIPHMVQVPLGDAIAGLCSRDHDVRARLHAALDGFDAVGRRTGAAASLREVGAVLERCRRAAVEAGAEARRVKGTRARDSRQLAKMEARLSKLLGPVQPLLVSADLGTFRPLLERQPTIATLEESFEWSIAFHEAVTRTAGELAPLAQAAADSLEAAAP